MSTRLFDEHLVSVYSNLINWLEALSMKSAHAGQWISTISAAKGMRGEEIERSGLIPYLSQFEPTEKLNKDLLINLAEEELLKCQISLKTERTTKYQPVLQYTSFPFEDIPNRVLTSFSDAEVISCHKLTSFNFKIIRLKFTGMFGSNESWFVFDENWRQYKPSVSYKNSAEAIDFLYSVAENRFSNYSSKAQLNYYEDYSLLGKNNRYKEWVVTLPNLNCSFERSHFGLENVVLHLRSSEWKDTNGQQLLLIDEVQSDWHALGRENGYYSEEVSLNDPEVIPDAPFKKEWHELGVKLSIWIALQSGYTRVAFTQSHVHKTRYGQNLKGFDLIYNQLIPKSLAKLATKFKCILKVDSIVVSRPADTMFFRHGVGWELKNKYRKEDTQIIKNKVVAMRYLENRGEKEAEEVTVFEVSPELADLVKFKGVPIFGLW